MFNTINISPASFNYWMEELARIDEFLEGNPLSVSYHNEWKQSVFLVENLIQETYGY